MNYYQNLIHKTPSEYHYHPSLLPQFLYYYQKAKQDYINFIDNVNASLRDQMTSLKIKENKQFFIEDYQPIVSFNELMNPMIIHTLKNDYLIPMAILESMISSSAKSFKNHETFVHTIIGFYNEIKNSSMIMPTLRDYLHHLVYCDHFIPYNILKKPYNIKQIRSAIQFLEVIWILEPEIIFTWIDWGWGNVDGEIPLVLFASYYDCRAMETERSNNQAIRTMLQQHLLNQSRTLIETKLSCYHHDHHCCCPLSPRTILNDNTDIFYRINTSQSRLFDYMWEKHFTISCETLYFIMENNVFNCSCYDIMGRSSESPCRIKLIIKNWKHSNDKKDKLKLVHHLAYNAWSRKDGVGLYKLEYYLNVFNDHDETLLNINEFIIEMITLDPSVIFKQDMLGWIINHSHSQHVKKLILYTLFMTLPNDPKQAYMIKLILNFVGDIDLKAIQLLTQIDKNHRIWKELYSVIIIHLYRRYVRRKNTLDPQLCDAWANLFLNLNPYKFELTSIQTRYQDGLFELLDIY